LARYLSDADAEGERLPALAAAVEHRAVLQPPRVMRLHAPTPNDADEQGTSTTSRTANGADPDELSLLGGGAGADDAVAEGEPGRRHLQRALPTVRGSRRRGEHEAGEDGGRQHVDRGLAPPEDEAGVLLARRRGRGGAGVPRGAWLREADEEEAGQRRSGRGRGRSHGCLAAGADGRLPLPLVQWIRQGGRVAASDF